MQSFDQFAQVEVLLVRAAHLLANGTNTCTQGRIVPRNDLRIARRCTAGGNFPCALDGGLPENARRTVTDRVYERVDACRVDFGQVDVELRTEDHAHGTRPRSGEGVVELDAHELVGSVGGVHELATDVVLVVAALYLLHVVGREKDKDHVRGVDATAHGVQNVATHVRLVEPYRKVTTVQFSDHLSDSGMVAGVDTPVVRREQANGRHFSLYVSVLLCWYNGVPTQQKEMLHPLDDAFVRRRMDAKYGSTRSPCAGRTEDPVVIDAVDDMRLRFLNAPAQSDSHKRFVAYVPRSLAVDARRERLCAAYINVDELQDLRDIVTVPSCLTHVARAGMRRVLAPGPIRIHDIHVAVVSTREVGALLDEVVRNTSGLEPSRCTRLVAHMCKTDAVALEWLACFGI